MPDARISELPAASAPADTDLTALVQTSGASLITRRASLTQLRAAVQDGRSAHVRDYGAVGDGITNDAPAIQAAITDLASKGGGILEFAAKTYRLASAITIGTVAVKLQGKGFVEGPSPGNGTWLKVDTTGFTPITFSGTAARGGGIADIAFHQTHNATQNASWVPTGYDYLIRIQDCLGGVDIHNVFLCAINRGIYCDNSGRLDIHRLRGQIFTTGVEIDDCYDVARLRGIHFWPFSTSNTFVMQYIQANCDAMLFRRVDGAFIDQAFVFGARSMFRFSSGTAGVTTKFYIGQAYADFVQHGVLVEGAGTDGLIDSLTTQGQAFGSAGLPLAGATGIRIAAPNCRVQIGNLRCDLVRDNAIRVEQFGNRLDIFALRCVNFNSQANGSAAIHLVDSAANPANAVYLGCPALLEGVTGPLQNASSNGILASGSPPGSAARPGLGVGSTNTGLFLPNSNALGLTAGGVEVLRANSTGNLTFGAAPSGHALEVVTPVATSNRVLISGAASGAGVSIQAQGADANVPLLLAAKGSGGILATGTLTVSANGGANLARIGGAASGGAVVLGVDSTSTDTNVSVAIGTPKGTGALSAHLADNAVTGGNARGANAVDWQTSRSSVAQVASGTSACIPGGVSCQASGAASFATGSFVTASGAFAVAMGRLNTADGVASVATGINAHVHALQGAQVHSSGQIVAIGDAQAGTYTLAGRGTAGAAVRLTANSAVAGSTNVANLPVNTAWSGTLRVTAREITTGNCARWAISFGLGKVATAATTTLVIGTVEFQNIIGVIAAAGNLASSADTINGGLNLTFTPPNTNSWDVVAVLRTSEVQ